MLTYVPILFCYMYTCIPICRAVFIYATGLLPTRFGHNYIHVEIYYDLGVGGGTFAIWLVEFGQYMYCLFIWEICSSRKSKHRDDSSDMKNLCSLLNPVFSNYGCNIPCII